MKENYYLSNYHFFMELFLFILIGSLILGMENEPKFIALKQDIQQEVLKGNLDTVTELFNKLDNLFDSTYIQQEEQIELLKSIFNNDLINNTIKSKNVPLIFFVVQMSGQNLNDFLVNHKQDWPKFLLYLPYYLEVKRKLEIAIKNKDEYLLKQAINDMPRLSEELEEFPKKSLSKLNISTRTIIGQRRINAFYEKFEPGLLNEIQNFWVDTLLDETLFNNVLNGLNNATTVEDYEAYIDLIIQLLKASKKDISSFIEQYLEPSTNALVNVIKKRLMDLIDQNGEDANVEFSKLTSDFHKIIYDLKSKILDSSGDNQLLTNMLMRYVKWLFLPVAEKAIKQNNSNWQYLILDQLIEQIEWIISFAINSVIVITDPGTNDLFKSIKQLINLPSSDVSFSTNKLINILLLRLAFDYIKPALLKERYNPVGKLLSQVLDQLGQIGFSKHEILNSIGQVVLNLKEFYSINDLNNYVYRTLTSEQTMEYNAILERGKKFYTLLKSIDKDALNTAVKNIDDAIPVKNYWLLFENDLKGDTPLMHAIYREEFELVKLLIDKGSDVNYQRNYGITPLMAAAARAQVKVVKLLLEKGANPEMLDVYGRNALYYSNRPVSSLLHPEKINEYDEIKQLLMNASKISTVHQKYNIDEQIDILKELSANLISLANKNYR